MHTFAHTVEIAAPVDRVVAFDTNPENWPRTMAGMSDVEIVEETDDGCRMVATYRLLGMPIDGEMEMTVDEDANRMRVTFDGSGMRGETHTRYSAIDGGTRIEQRVEYELGDSLLNRVIEPVAKRYNERQFRAHLQNTKELVEAEATIAA